MPRRSPAASTTLWGDWRPGTAEAARWPGAGSGTLALSLPWNGGGSVRARLGCAAVGVTVVVALLAANADTSRTLAAADAAAACSRKAAQAALREHPKVDPVYIRSIEFPAEVLCGPFLGPGSRAMAVGFAPAVCDPAARILGWGVYRLRSGRWQPVWKTWTGTLGIKAVGDSIEETAAVSYPADLHCGTPPTATQTRLWRWNGRTFVAGPWT
jgi:hypothetical protein